MATETDDIPQSTTTRNTLCIKLRFRVFYNPLKKFSKMTGTLFYHYFNYMSVYSTKKIY